MELRDLFREMSSLPPGALARASVAFLLEEGRLRHETGKFSIESTRLVSTAEAQEMVAADFWRRRVYPVERRDRKPGEITIGRAKGSDINFELSSVSAVHALVTLPARGQWQIADKGSKNGTFIDGVKLKPNEATPLRVGSIVTVGLEVKLTFLDGGAMERVLRQLNPVLTEQAAQQKRNEIAGAKPPSGTGPVAPAIPAAVPASASPPPPPPPAIARTAKLDPKLLGLPETPPASETAGSKDAASAATATPTGRSAASPAPTSGEPAPASAASDSVRRPNEPPLSVTCPPFPPVGLETGVPVIVGRAVGSDLILPHPNVSRRHSCFERQGDVVMVRDLGSANGTYVAKRKIEAPTKVEPGQEVSVGPYKVLLAAEKSQTPEGSADLGTRLEL